MTGRVGPPRTGSASLTEAGPTRPTVTKFAGETQELAPENTVLGKIYSANQFNPIAQAGGQIYPPLHDKRAFFLNKKKTFFEFQQF